MEDMTDADALAAARAALAAAVERLRAADAPQEELAERVPPRRVLGVVPRPATMRRLGPVWRLGVLLVTPDARLFATGVVTVADRRVRPGHQALSAHARQELRRIALRAGFEEGTTVDFDARPIDLDDPAALRDPAGPVVLAAGGVGVRWTPSVDALVPFDRYLDERIDLLLESNGT
jgi:hypothetical protein